MGRKSTLLACILVFTIDSAAVIKLNLFYLHGGFLTYTMYHNRETTKSIKQMRRNKEKSPHKK